MRDILQAIAEHPLAFILLAVAILMCVATFGPLVQNVHHHHHSHDHKPSNEA